MITLVVTASPPKLRGHLTRWLMEISPGVYVGSVPARVRDLLWQQVLENLADGRAIMAYSAQNEQGLEFRTHGQDWQPLDFDGVTLMLRPNTSQEQQRNGRRAGFSKVSRMRRYGR
ncbi:type I-E CRISPR-associated endoribonuclease Cas2e [Pseudoclavibacter sp. CFCC 13611]|uniref:type I-E CRISPR-associated endoribonuclease Cas2e n=1 Tax=Pseudoclavibacter sp. CFCC 13611 TaxID=2615178 RepID=UPI0013015272|nr:type I-E CRISPR-associated endoribonuclease Cas2e [Pseudoclavibacter sp. CFCC 13611]KAB1662973.1 type I-E CRISPR-associated endoribonuclease Cas2 [Pseudoclavibacter sp. CFCC 13611]